MTGDPLRCLAEGRRIRGVLTRQVVVINPKGYFLGSTSRSTCEVKFPKTKFGVCIGVTGIRRPRNAPYPPLSHLLTHRPPFSPHIIGQGTEKEDSTYVPSRDPGTRAAGYQWCSDGSYPCDGPCRLLGGPYSVLWRNPV